MDPLTPLHGFLLIAGLVILAVEAWALIDAVTRPAQTYVAADKQTKNVWLVLLGLSVVMTFLLGRGGLSIFAIIGLIIALVYLLDVRPAVREVQRQGGSSSQGPYGP